MKWTISTFNFLVRPSMRKCAKVVDFSVPRPFSCPTVLVKMRNAPKRKQRMSLYANIFWICVCVLSRILLTSPPHTQTGKKSNAYAKFLMDGLPNLRLSDSLKIFKLQKVKIFPRKVWRQADNGNEGMKRFHFLWIPTIIPFCQKLKKSEQHDKVSLEFFQYKGAQFPDIKSLVLGRVWVHFVFGFPDFFLSSKEHC